MRPGEDPHTARRGNLVYVIGGRSALLASSKGSQPSSSTSSDCAVQCVERPKAASSEPALHRLALTDVLCAKPAPDRAANALAAIPVKLHAESNNLTIHCQPLLVYSLYSLNSWQTSKDPGLKCLREKAVLPRCWRYSS